MKIPKDLEIILLGIGLLLFSGIMGFLASIITSGFGFWLVLMSVFSGIGGFIATGVGIANRYE